MSWNYRVIRRKHGEFQICEVFYDKKDKPNGWAAVAILASDTKKGLAQELEYVGLALKRPFLAETKTGKLKAYKKTKPKERK